MEKSLQIKVHCLDPHSAYPSHMKITFTPFQDFQMSQLNVLSINFI